MSQQSSSALRPGRVLTGRSGPFRSPTFPRPRVLARPRAPFLPGAPEEPVTRGTNHLRPTGRAPGRVLRGHPGGAGDTRTLGDSQTVPRERACLSRAPLSLARRPVTQFGRLPSQRPVHTYTREATAGTNMHGDGRFLAPDKAHATGSSCQEAGIWMGRDRWFVFVSAAPVRRQECHGPGPDQVSSAGEVPDFDCGIGSA